MSCWLCRFNTTEPAKLYHTFVVENLGTMSLDEMALEISSKQPECAKEDVKRHFQQHSLHPSIRITIMLRSLLDISDSLKHSVTALDDAGHASVDTRVLDAYLKLQTQILTIYRMGDTKRLMFA